MTSNCLLIFEGDGDLFKDSFKFRCLCRDTDDAIRTILHNHKFTPKDFPELDDVPEDEIEEALYNVIENHLMFDGTVKSEKRDLSYIIVRPEEGEWVTDILKYT